MIIAICDSSMLFMNKFIEEAKKIVPTINIDCFSEYNALVNSDDLVLYDSFFIATEINRQSGIDVALDIYTSNPVAEIVFITENCEKYCQRIFDHADRFKPFAFLCKPVSRLLLRHILEMLGRVNEHKKSRDIVIRLEDKDYISINTSDIMYIQHNNRISYIYTFDGRCYSSKHSISWFDDKLPDCFFHCAKSCIVNTLNVKSVNGLEIKLSNNSSIWSSRQYRKTFVESFEKYHSAMGMYTGYDESTENTKKS